jgi:hypothetical protein
MSAKQMRRAHSSILRREPLPRLSESVTQRSVLGIRNALTRRINLGLRRWSPNHRIGIYIVANPQKNRMM